MSAIHGARIQSAARSLSAATAALLSFIHALPEQIAHTQLPGGWTPAGHVCHVALTNDIFTGTIAGGGPLPVFAGGSDFTDDEWSFNVPPSVAAPDLIVPALAVSREAADFQLTHSVKPLINAIEMMTPARSVMCVQLPWATVSLMQVAEWSTGHTLRHLSQVGRELQLSVGRSSTTR